MSDVFISYSRLDKAFVAQLREALVAQKQDIWIDWEDIPPSQAWWEEIKKGIARANNFVVILSPNSLGSPVCHLEIEYARSLKKRIIPVYHADYTREACLSAIQQRLSKKEDTTTKTIWGTRQPEAVFDDNARELSPINYFFFKAEDDFQTRFDELFKIIRTDFEHKERHTTYELRAAEWKRRREDPSFLLLDNELEEARVWLSSAAGKEPSPTDLQSTYIAASEKRTRQLATIRRASIIGSGVAAVAIVFAVTASLMGVQAAGRAREANDQQATSVVILGTAEHRANDADHQRATSVAVQATAERRADNANTQVAVAAMTATQSAVIQHITDHFANVMIQGNLSSLGSLDRAEAMSEMVTLYPEQPSAYILRGLAHEMEGQYDLAVEDYSIAIAIEPNGELGYFNRATAYASLGELDLALADYDTVLRINPEDVQVYFNRADLYQMLGEMDLALADYTAALALNPEDVEIYNNRALVYAELEQFEQAIDDFNAALEIDPTYAFGYLNRGAVYSMQGQTDLALADFARAIELTPTDPAAYMGRAYALFGSGQNEEAIASVTEGIENIPLSATLYDTRCELYLKTEQWRLGLEDCDKVLILDPTWTFTDELAALIDTAREQVGES